MIVSVYSLYLEAFLVLRRANILLGNDERLTETTNWFKVKGH